MSRPYDFYFAGTDGVPRTLPAARMQTSSGNFGFYSGIAGTVEIPVLRLDALTMRASNDVDLLFRDITVGVIDIDAAVPGVLGMNVLNSVWEIHALHTIFRPRPRAARRVWPSRPGFPQHVRHG